MYDLASLHIIRPFDSKTFRMVKDVYIGSKIENLVSKEIVHFRRSKSDIMYRRKIRIMS